MHPYPPSVDCSGCFSIHKSFLGTIFLRTDPMLQALTHVNQSESSVFLVTVIGSPIRGLVRFLEDRRRRGYTENMETTRRVAAILHCTRNFPE